MRVWALIDKKLNGLVTWYEWEKEGSFLIKLYRTRAAARKEKNKTHRVVPICLNLILSFHKPDRESAHD